MAKPAKTPKAVKAPKPDIASRAGGWLPYVAALLCLGLVGMAVATLVNINAEPESPPSGHVTSVAAQGFAGLRRLLEAQGANVRLNRFEDGSKDVDRGDVEIITLDDDGGVFNGEFDSAGESSSASGSTSASSGTAVSSASGGESSAAASASASSDSSTSSQVRRLRQAMGQDDGYGIPDPRRVGHLLYHPLGRAVLVVAPKWTVSRFTGPRRRWGQGPDLMAPSDVANILAVLSPLSWHALPKAAKPPAKAKTGDDDEDAPAPERAFDRPAYTLSRAGTAQPVTLTPAERSPLSAAIAAGSIDRLQAITGPNLIPVVTGPHGEALLSRVIVTPAPDGRKRPQPSVPVYLVSDPDLLDNQILSDPKRTAAALALVHALTPPAKKAAYVFNLSFNGEGFDHDMVHALSRPPWLAVPLSLLICSLGLMWAAFARFGPPMVSDMRPALGRGVRILADNAARLMAMTLKETKLGLAYAQLMRDQVLKIRGYRALDPRESADALADRISQIYQAPHSYSELKAQASRVMTVHQLIDVALRLHAWKTRIGQTPNEKMET